jgi:hypothetical protein
MGLWIGLGTTELHVTDDAPIFIYKLRGISRLFTFITKHRLLT